MATGPGLRTSERSALPVLSNQSFKLWESLLQDHVQNHTEALELIHGLSKLFATATVILGYWFTPRS